MMTKERWAELKKIRPRGPVAAKPHQRKKFPCTCIHRPKHHRKRGGCRRDCPCKAGVR